MKRFKMNMVVGKRQIVLAALVMCLSLAVYINWVYSQDLPDFPTNAGEQGKNYGDSQYVDGVENGEAFFAEAKLNRQKTRDEAAQTLKTLIDSQNVPAEQRTQLALKATEIAQTIESEGKIENLIKAKGFSECMVYYDAQRVDVIVKTKGLLANEVAQMKDIIVKEVSVPAEKISIIEVK